MSAMLRSSCVPTLQAPHARCITSRKAFSGARIAVSPAKQLQQRRLYSSGVHAFVREYPDPDFIAETKEAFPEKGVATVEEARVLFSEDGYTYLDVRSPLELEEIGRVKGCVNVPMTLTKKVYDPKVNKKVVKREDNPDWLAQALKRFPDKETKLIVACSDGRKYTIDALTQLDEEGYTNLVGLKGGFYAWFRVFDNKLGRRRTGEYAETYTHDADSCGIHSSGAGFERVDTVGQWQPPPGWD